MPSHLDIFVLSPSEKNMIKNVNEIEGSYSNKKYYQDPSSLYIFKWIIMKN